MSRRSIVVSAKPKPAASHDDDEALHEHESIHAVAHGVSA